MYDILTQDPENEAKNGENYSGKERGEEYSISYSFVFEIKQ